MSRFYKVYSTHIFKLFQVGVLQKRRLSQVLSSRRIKEAVVCGETSLIVGWRKINSSKE